MFTKIRVLHLAVNNLEEAVKDYQERFGFKVLPQGGERPDLGLRNAFLAFGDQVIEIIEPLNPGQGPIAKFLENRGEGVYMMGWEVENINNTIKILQEKGVRLINADTEARAKGAMVFVHPKSPHGIMIELIEEKK